MGGTQLTLAAAHLFERRFVSERVLARLYDKRETGRDRLARLCGLGFLAGGHGGSKVVESENGRLEFAAVKDPAIPMIRGIGVAARAPSLDMLA